MLMTRLLFAATAGVLLSAQTAPPPDATDLYYVVFLRPAPDRKPLAEGEGERIQAAHMANIRSMAERGVLIAAGPFGDMPTTISGIFVFKAASLAETRRIAEQDPTVLEHRNTVEAYPWRGPRGIGEEYVRLHKADPKTPEGMGVHPLQMLFWGSGERKADLVRAHAGYVAQLRREGKMAAAGHIEGDYGLAGIMIFNRIPVEEAERLTAADPAVSAGLLRAESHRWWCAAHVLPE
jgi:uncharacterized protein YciI